MRFRVKFNFIFFLRVETTYHVVKCFLAKTAFYACRPISQCDVLLAKHTGLSQGRARERKQGTRSAFANARGAKTK